MTRHSRTRAAIALVAAASLAGCGIFRGGGGPKQRTLGERIPVLNFEQQVEAAPELADLVVVLPPAVVNADWSQPGGSASKSLGHVTLPDPVQRAWTTSIGRGSDATRRLNASPVVADNRVYTIDVDANITAFDAIAGSVLWRARIDRKGEGDAPAFGGGVSVEGGRLYATSGYGIVAAFDAVSGAEVWRRQLAVPLRGAPAIAGGRLYVKTVDNQLIALSTDKGETQWEVNGTVEPAAILGGGSPAVAQDTLVAGFSSGELFALRVENGRTVWQDALSRTGRTTALAALADIEASPVIDRGRVFAIGHAGRMAALELATGQRVWERNFAGVSTPWVAGDFVFVVTIDGQLVCLTRGEGRIRWITQVPRWKNERKRSGPIEWFGPVLAGDRLILTSSDGRMMFVSPLDGKIQQTQEIGERSFLPPVVAANTLYVLTDDGRLSAYR